MSRIWTPPIEREVNPRDPFDVLYRADCSIRDIDDPLEMDRIAEDTMSRLGSAALALESSAFNVYTDLSIMHSAEGDEAPLLERRPITCVGNFIGLKPDRITYMDAGVIKLHRTMFSLVIEPQSVWLSDTFEPLQYQPAEVCSLIATTTQIHY